MCDTLSHRGHDLFPPTGRFAFRSKVKKDGHIFDYRPSRDWTCRIDHYKVRYTRHVLGFLTNALTTKKKRLWLAGTTASTLCEHTSISSHTCTFLHSRAHGKPSAERIQICQHIARTMARAGDTATCDCHKQFTVTQLLPKRLYNLLYISNHPHWRTSSAACPAHPPAPICNSAAGTTPSRARAPAAAGAASQHSTAL